MPPTSAVEGALLRSVVGSLLILAAASCGGDDRPAVPDGGGPGVDGGAEPIPVRCGNGIRDGADECEGNDGCADGERCTATCTCEALPPVPTTSQSLIADALARGDIDYPTSLLYRAWALFGDSRLPPEYDGEVWVWEDNGVFREATTVWNSLDAETQAGLLPFLLRPTEEGSYYSPLPARMTLGGPTPGTPPPVDCPYAPGADTRDWRATESTHFVIWSCGGGDPAADPLATQRTVVAGIAEEVFGTMTRDTGLPEPDVFPVVAGVPDARIDVYLVTPNLCRSRDGGCVALPPPEIPGAPTLAAAVGTRPCAVGRTGALAASSFLMVDSSYVPAVAGASPNVFRYVFAHELFHLMQNALNLEAQGGGCNDGMVDDTVTSWLVEASAEWAAAVYYPNDYPQRRTDLFTVFQQRDPRVLSLRAMGGNALDYQAFIYPRFVEQELGVPTGFIDMWKSSGAARSAAQLDDLLDDLLPFADHFRDFAVRNFNTSLVPGDPGSPRYHAIDRALPEGLKPVVLEPQVTLDFPGELRRPVELQPLTAQYEHFVIDPHIQSVRVDLQEVESSAFVQMDVLARVGDTWERRAVRGLVFEVCREDPGDEIEELYLIVSHHDRRDGMVASGDYRIETRLDCPSTWHGTIRFVHTLDDYTARTDAAGSESHHRSEREVQTWTVTGSRETDWMGTGQRYTELSLNWSASFERQVVVQVMATACHGGMSYSSESTSGVGGGSDVLSLFPLGAGSYSASPSAVPEGQIDAVGAQSVELCTGEGASFPTSDTRADQIAVVFASVSGLSMLVPTEPGGMRYTGSATIMHSEEPQEGGSIVLDQSVTWDLQRR